MSPVDCFFVFFLYFCEFFVFFLYFFCIFFVFFLFFPPFFNRNENMANVFCGAQKNTRKKPAEKTVQRALKFQNTCESPQTALREKSCNLRKPLPLPARESRQSTQAFQKPSARYGNPCEACLKELSVLIYDSREIKEGGVVSQQSAHRCTMIINVNVYPYVLQRSCLPLKCHMQCNVGQNEAISSGL